MKQLSCSKKKISFVHFLPKDSVYPQLHSGLFMVSQVMQDIVGFFLTLSELQPFEVQERSLFASSIIGKFESLIQPRRTMLSLFM
jgi:hypothetical protein